MKEYWIVLNDRASTAHALNAQVESAALMRCSVCEVALGPDEADSSQRCDQCRP